MLPSNAPPTYAELGITKRESSEAQKLAEMRNPQGAICFAGVRKEGMICRYDGMMGAKTVAANKRELREAERRGYRKGAADGERRARKLLNCMRATNAHLLDLTRLLDTEYPITGVLISFDLAERIIKGLRSASRQGKIASELRQVIDHANRELSPELACIEDELLELVG